MRAIVTDRPGSFRVTAQDMFSNTTSSFTDMVHFTSSDPKVVLPDDYTFTSADNGVHDFMATLTAIGSADEARATVQRYRDAGVTSPGIGAVPKTDFAGTLEALAGS